jgi:hypothetical protein
MFFMVDSGDVDGVAQPEKGSTCCRGHGFYKSAAPCRNRRIDYEHVRERFDVHDIVRRRITTIFEECVCSCATPSRCRLEECCFTLKAEPQLDTQLLQQWHR